jgi:hypothetical protein
VTGSQQNTTGSSTLADDVTSSRCTQDTALTDQKLLHSIGSSNLRDQLHDLGVPVSSITTNDQETVFGSFWDGEQDTSNEGFTVVRLLKDDDLFSQP